VNRTIVIGVPAMKKGAEVGGQMIFGGLTTGTPPGPYGVYARASTTMRRELRTGADGAVLVEETWNSKADNGDAVELHLQYVRGIAATSKIDVRTYSGTKPEFYRIYRYTQAADVLRGAGAQSDRVKSFTFKASGPTLSPLFDGTEQIVSITALPYYSRQIFFARVVISSICANPGLGRNGSFGSDCVIRLGERRKGAAGSTQRPDPPVGRGGFGVRP
jgi:hypothetical protein